MALSGAAFIQPVPGRDLLAVMAEFPAAVSNRPEVAQIVVFPARVDRQHRIVHLCNWHMIPRKSFEAALKAYGLSVEEIERRIAEHMVRVESVQNEQHSLMLFLVNELGLRVVHLEGLCPDDTARFAKRLVQMKQAIGHGTEVPGHRSFAEQVHEDLLLAGVVGQMTMEGTLRFLPVEDRTAFEAANPMLSDGTFVDDPPALKRREAAIVRNLIQASPVSFVILGGLHDLSDDVPDDCEYVRIETIRYAEMMACRGGKPAITVVNQ